MATNLKGGAGVLAAMAPDLLDMAHTFASVIPSVLEAATGFEKSASPILSLLEKRVKQQEELVAMEDEVAKTRDLNKELVQELKVMQHKLVVLESKKRRDGKRSMADLADAPPRAENVVVLECTTQTSDNLVLSQFKGDVQQDVTVKDGSGMAKPLYTDVPIQVGYSQLQTEKEEKGKATMESAEEMESLLQNLEVANKERDEARAELEALRRTLTMVDDTPCNENTMPWLGWVHCLQDTKTLISKAQHDLKKYAAKSGASCELVDTILKRFKSTIGERGQGSGRVSIWSEIGEMMERTDYARLGKSNALDWALEVAEGWVPYSIFSSHFVEVERKVVHTCDTVPALLQDKCSICQEHFGPEGAYTLGQCGHTFHITCIAASSLIRRACIMCCSLISARFYELMGRRDVMPPGHEFNQWNLPLDQLPKKFLNYRD